MSPPWRHIRGSRWLWQISYPSLMRSHSAQKEGDGISPRLHGMHESINTVCACTQFFLALVVSFVYRLSGVVSSCLVVVPQDRHKPTVSTLRFTDQTLIKRYYVGTLMLFDWDAAMTTNFKLWSILALQWLGEVRSPECRHCSKHLLVSGLLIDRATVNYEASWETPKREAEEEGGKRPGWPLRKYSDFWNIELWYRWDVIELGCRSETSETRLNREAHSHRS